MSACRVYWGTHGCCLPRGHKGHHACSCTFENNDPTQPLLPHADDPADNGNVGRHPYYGPNTTFYGEDT